MSEFTQGWNVGYTAGKQDEFRRLRALWLFAFVLGIAIGAGVMVVL